MPVVTVGDERMCVSTFCYPHVCTCDEIKSKELLNIINNKVFIFFLKKKTHEITRIISFVISELI